MQKTAKLQQLKEKKMSVPLKYYCHKSGINNLEEMLKRPGGFKKCK